MSTTKSYDSTPGFLAVSMGTPPYIAMTLGDKVVTVMDYSGVYKEEVRGASRRVVSPPTPAAR